MIDGVYAVGPGGALVIHPLPAPTDADVGAITERVVRKISNAVDALYDAEELAAREPPGRADLDPPARSRSDRRFVHAAATSNTMALALPKGGCMTTSMKVRIPLLLFSIVAPGGCGSSGPPGTDPDDSVLVEGASAFTVTSSGGGFVFPPPQGAACDPGPWTYAVRIATAEFLWNRCDVTGDSTDPASYTPSYGSRILPASDLDAALTAARMVHVSNKQNACGADKPFLYMSVTSPAGSQIYGDDFYACLKQEDAYVVSHELDTLAGHLSTLVP
jgi:hypothetical protein